MIDEKLLQYVRDLAAVDDPERLDEAEAVDSPAAPSDTSGQRDESAWPRFVNTVLRNLHPRPIRRKDTTIGDLLREALKETNFTRDDVAAAIGKDVDFIKQIEASKLPISSFDPKDTADFVAVLRAHSEMIEALLPKYPLPVGQEARPDLLRYGGASESANVVVVRRKDDEWFKAFCNRLRERNENDLLD